MTGSNRVAISLIASVLFVALATVSVRADPPQNSNAKTKEKVRRVISPQTEKTPTKKNRKSDAPKKPSPDRVVLYKTTKQAKLRLNMFLPPDHRAHDSRPAIVFFFGGGWVGGSPSQFYGQCKALADIGVVAISAEYRVRSRNKTTPKECVADGKSAMRYVRANAAQLGIDP
ncbi:MAG: carboxylesterase family protein, partial [Planctomycetota bacterium]